ncbi:MAG: protoporphyrinogen oxidase [Aureliella sp.]
MSNSESNLTVSRVAVIGGGVSGLSAATYASRLAQSPKVSLFERSDRIGGVIQTHRDGDYLIEKAADNFATLIPDALELSKLVGVDDQLIAPREEGRRAFVLHRGELRPIPAGFSLMQPTRVGSILATRTLSLGGKLRLLGEFFVKARQAGGDESLESFVTRRLGREAYENLVEPIVSGIFTANPKTLSMQATMPQFLAMERNSGGLIRGHLSAKRKDAAAAARKASGARYDQFRAPRDGMDTWLEGITSQLPEGCLHLNTSVEAIVADGDSWRIQLADQADQVFDAVILATPTHVTSRLLENVSKEASRLASSIEYASSAVAAMIVNRRDIAGRLDGFGMISPSRENRHALAISYTSNKYEGRVPEDQVLLRVFMGGAMNPGVMELPDDELEMIAKREVQEILKWDGKDPNWIQIIRWNQAMPQYTLGHRERVASLKEELSKTPTLQVCGAGYDGVGIPQCVKSGRLAAEAIGKALPASSA